MKLRWQTIRHDVVAAIQVAGCCMCERANCRRKSEGKGGTQAEGVGEQGADRGRK